MKIAVLSDIHGNAPALEAVIADIDEFAPDAVFVNGDIVNRGPRSLDAWRLVCERRDRAGWRLLRGNHEEYVAASRAALASGAASSALHRMSAHTAAQLGDQARIAGELPDGASLLVEGSEIRIRHASMRGNTDGIDADAPLALLASQIAPPPACFVTGHTHRPARFHVGGALVVNAGSVGAPADGDPRASYARLRWRSGRLEVEPRRVAYDRARAARDYADEEWLAGAGPLAALLYVEWRRARPVLAGWTERHLRDVQGGRVDLADSVASALAAWGEDPRLVIRTSRG